MYDPVMGTPDVPQSVPERAQVVVIGGGIIGCSVAYHLAHMGWKDVVVLERDRITSGTTWHAAGLMVTFGSFCQTSAEMRKYSRELYGRLEAETGQATGFRAIGFIEAATDPDRLEEYRRVSAFNRHCGIEVEEISPTQIKDLFPLAHTDDILAGFYVEKDGRVDPVDVTMALAKGARMQGAKILEGVTATGVQKRGTTVTGVKTDAGTIEAEYVVNCAGMWARQLGDLAGVNIPLQAAEHYYLITDSIPEIKKTWPVFEAPGSHAYFREEGGGLMIGLFEPVCAPWNVDRIPDDFSFGTIPPDWDRMAPYLETAMKRVPISQDVGIKKFFCGPESFTPDLQPVVGESPELKNYFVAAGLNSVGILTAGGIGRVLAHWIINGRPDVDVTAMHIDRLHPYQCTPKYRAERTVESLGMVYQCHYPTRSMQTARGVKLSPIHERLVARGAYFRDVSGWEGADWYAPEGVQPVVEQLSWGKQNWFPYWAAEHKAARDGVILMDMSFMAKFLVEGQGAGALLNRLSANEVATDTGMIVYTQWLNEGGTIEADLTVAKLGDERYWVVTSDTTHRHVAAWMQRHTDAEARIQIHDQTNAYAQINIQGPRSRELMQRVTDLDLSTENFPFRSVAETSIGFARVLCIRITYLGELGYELYIPAEQAISVYDILVKAGEPIGLRHAGLKALASLRLEKAYRDYGHDIDNTDTPLEAGLGFAVNYDKPDGFIGRDALLAQKASGPLRKRLLQVLVLDPDPMMFHGEVLRRNGEAVGHVRAASYGHSLGGAVGLAAVTADEVINKAYLDAGSWQVEIAERLYPAKVSFRPLYDPKMEKVRV